MPAMRSRWTSLFVLIHLAAFNVAATAQTLDRQRCFGPRPATVTVSAIDDRIGGCTAIIGAGRETPENLFKAFISRGFAYLSRGKFSTATEDYDHAIQDYDHAIRLNPNYANSFNNRGLAYLAKNQFERAIQDFDEAIRLDPEFAFAFYNRGSAERAKGDSARGDADITKALQLDPSVAPSWATAMSSWFTVALQHYADHPVLALLGLAALLYALFKLLGLSVLYNGYLIGRFVKRSNFRRWVERTFRSPFASKAAIADRAQGLDTEHLFWGLKLSDHTAKSRNLIVAELHRRGVSDVQISNWMPQAAQITSISCAAVPSSTAKCRRIERQRRKCFSVYRLLAFPLFILIVMSTCTTTSDQMLWVEPFGREPGHAPLIPGAEDIAVVLVYLMILVSSVAVFTERQRSLRLLLLRPFGRPKLTRALRKVVINQLGPIATTYTLSDRDYRPGFFLMIFDRSTDLWRTAVGALYRPSRLLMNVRNERTFLNLARVLPHVIGPSFKTFVVGDQALRIKATNDWWQLVIDMLMHSVDLIVMDISDIGWGSSWEILQLSRRGLERNCIFICQEGYDQRGLNALRQLDSDFDPERFYIYTAEGRFKNISAFDSKMDALCDRALRQRQKRKS